MLFSPAVLQNGAKRDAMCLKVIEKLAEAGVKFIAMRCAGFDRVDVEAGTRQHCDGRMLPGCCCSFRISQRAIYTKP